MVKSKRAREAADAEAGPATTPVTNDNPKSEKSDKKEKKRKRDTEEAAITNGDSDDEEKKKAAKKAKKEKKDKKAKYTGKESRKDKKDKLKDLQDLPEEAESEAEGKEAPAKTAEEQAKEEKRAKKKAKKDKKKQDKTTADAAQPDSSAGVSSTTPAEKSFEDKIDLNAETAEKKDRHIVFVGNLPFSATAASITAHFATLSPIAVRCLTEKGSKNPCKGIAFVEFGEVWQQRTCLDKFHHSEFNDGKSAARKINVELTAGGGGKTKQRREKILAKNAKLEENRNKRITREKTAKSENAAASQEHQESYIHPSRRAMM